jgi:hypothetical protein
MDSSETELRELMQALHSLPSGKLAASALLGHGARAIAPLREYLLHGRPRGIFQPRQLAVETLAELGAKDVLIEYLQTAKPIADPVVRFGEDAVISTAARALSRWPSEEVYVLLRGLSRERYWPGVVESLGQFERPQDLPYFLSALGEDRCADAADAAIRALGAAALDPLIVAARFPDLAAGQEIPTSLRRRRRIMRILPDLPGVAERWRDLRPLLHEPDPETAIAVAGLALQLGSPDERPLAARRLIDLLSVGDWFPRAQARAQLVAHFAAARQELELEIARRSAVPTRERAADSVLRILLGIRQEALRLEPR